MNSKVCCAWRNISVSIAIHLEHSCSAWPLKVCCMNSVIFAHGYYFLPAFRFFEPITYHQPDIYPLPELIWSGMNFPCLNWSDLNWHELPWSDLNCFYFQSHICGAHHRCHWYLFWVENKVERDTFWSHFIGVMSYIMWISSLSGRTTSDHIHTIIMAHKFSDYHFTISKVVNTSDLTSVVLNLFLSTTIS